ncbi:sugar-binding protein [Pseudomonas viridiflava]|uniref:sugar-binding protein n=1 Tax=Pseudomonas viridiflava TaxID=33069 RepID=UPI002EC3A4D0|nr:sugar-binding protein [Pseudomonas viridiflava]
MTLSTSVHSNAFNFMSFVQSGVDPRTGQYTVSITLPDIKTNGLRGPGFPLALNYNPLNTQDSGFGMGWNLGLSQYTPGSQILALSTGETFKVDDSNGDQLLMSEKKIDSFHFHEQVDSTYRVVHKSGQVEILEVVGSRENPVALPVQLFAPEGHSLKLTYTSFDNTHQLLSEVIDDAGHTLLSICRDDLSVSLRMSAGEGPDVEFLMRLGGSDHRVQRIELPTENAASWRFEYELFREHLCVTSLDTPAGGHEDIAYLDAGHQFPGSAGRQPLPRVTCHRTTPGFDQPEVEVHYTYQDSEGREHNFLGAGLEIDWADDGLDNLYKYGGAQAYNYVTTETLCVDDQDARTIERVFNQFHLLTLETTRQNNNVKEVQTLYYVDPDKPFDQQPNYCQLPREVRTVWRQLESGRVPRSEIVSSRYDTHGNLLSQTDANGVVETSVWYEAEGEEGYPPDPEGFVRNIKSRTVEPAASEYGQAPTLVTRYRYTSLDPIADSELDNWLAVQSETQVQIETGILHKLQASLDKMAAAVHSKQTPLFQRTARKLIEAVRKKIAQSEQPLQSIVYDYIDLPTDAFRHGRIGRQIVTLDGQDTTTDFAYDTLQSPVFGESVQRTVQTVTGFDGEQKVTTFEHSLLMGEPLLNRDDNDVEIRYAYDSLRRVFAETVAPDTMYEASRFYSYVLCADDGDQAEQGVFDVKGVKTISYMDGLHRVIREERDDADNPSPFGTRFTRPTYAAHYDPWGRLAWECEYDWLDARALALTSRFEYDDWGEQRCVTGPDGVRDFEETDPIGTDESKGPVRRSWSEGTDENGIVVKTGVTETWLNLFEKPTLVVRFDRDGKKVSQTQSHYDGLGRTVEEIVGLEPPFRETKFSYDAFGRAVRTTLPDNAIVHRTFARHSSEDLPVSISVEHAGKTFPLGEQVFDGLDRIRKTVTGGRQRVLKYEAGMLQPQSVTTASGKTVGYTYEPRLGSDPLQRTLEGVTSDYTYDPKNARLLHSQEQGERLERNYYSTGELKSEQRLSDGNLYSMQYRYSRLGRMLGYTDVLKQEQTFLYDDYGRLRYTSLGTTSTDFTYDALGRTRSITTTDTGNQQRVAVGLEYDDFGREILRTFDLAGVMQQMEQEYDHVDDMTRRLLTEGNTVIRDEAYGYDLRGRLTRYACEGTHCPVDPYGKTVSRQLFSFDGLDNLRLVQTSFGNESNIASYLYENPDPVQLSAVTNKHADYPARIDLTYDPDGNLIRDECNRTLKYDALGRLIEVGSPGVTIDSPHDPADPLAVASSEDTQVRR